MRTTGGACNGGLRSLEHTSPSMETRKRYSFVPAKQDQNKREDGHAGPGFAGVDRIRSDVVRGLHGRLVAREREIARLERPMGADGRRRPIRSEQAAGPRATAAADGGISGDLGSQYRGRALRRT